MDLVELIFPKNCFGCKKVGAHICPSCLEKEEVRIQICPVCGRLSISGKTHLKCLHELALNGLTSFWKYQGAIRRAVLAMKYKFAFDIAEELGNVLSEKLAIAPKRFPKTALLVPIPAYKDKVNWRGFNQAEEIGKVVAERLGLEFDNSLLTKKAKTVSQTELKRRERELNVHEVFEVSLHSLPDKGRPIVIFDDVWTTGATLNEAGRVLKRGGVKNVWGLTFARG